MATQSLLDCSDAHGLVISEMDQRKSTKEDLSSKYSDRYSRLQIRLRDRKHIELKFDKESRM